MNNFVVEVQDFHKTYGNFTAVDGSSFEVQRGEIFALLGPNGAGKTTTLECLEGLRQPDGGVLALGLALYLFNWDNQNKMHSNSMLGVLAMMPYALAAGYGLVITHLGVPYVSFTQ